jgi:hypothetical protein
MKPEFSLLELFYFFIVSITTGIVYRNKYVNKLKGVEFLKAGMTFLVFSSLLTNLESFFLPVLLNRLEHLFIAISGIFFILLVYKNKR